MKTRNAELEQLPRWGSIRDVTERFPAPTLTKAAHQQQRKPRRYVRGTPKATGRRNRQHRPRIVASHKSSTDLLIDEVFKQLREQYEYKPHLTRRSYPNIILYGEFNRRTYAAAFILAGLALRTHPLTVRGLMYRGQAAGLYPLSAAAAAPRGSISTPNRKTAATRRRGQQLGRLSSISTTCDKRYSNLTSVFYDGRHHLAFGYNALMLQSYSGGFYIFAGFGDSATLVLNTNVSPATFSWHVELGGGCPPSHPYDSLTFFGVANR